LSSTTPAATGELLAYLDDDNLIAD